MNMWDRCICALAVPAVPVIHEEDYKFEIGKGEVLKDGKDVAIIANGLMVAEALEAAETLKAEGIEAMVINMATIKPPGQRAGAVRRQEVRQGHHLRGA